MATKKTTKKTKNKMKQSLQKGPKKTPSSMKNKAVATNKDYCRASMSRDFYCYFTPAIHEARTETPAAVQKPQKPQKLSTRSKDKESEQGSVKK